MKTFTSILLLVAATFIASAQTPQKFNYQGVARNSAGNVIPNQNIGLQVTIHHSSPTGITVMQETHVTTTNDFGLFNLVIGDGTPTFADMSAISWAGGVYYIEIGLDAAGGSNYQSMGTSQLLSVPYALYAETAANPGPVGPIGPQGPVGPAGPAGSANASGTLNRISKFTPDGSSLGNSIITENNNLISVGGYPNWDKLEVADGNATNDVLDLLGLVRTNSTAGGGDGIGGALTFWNEVSNNAMTKAARISGLLEDAVLPTTGGALNIETLRSTGLTSAIYVNQSGNVGINTTTPTSHLDVLGSSNVTTPIISAFTTYQGNVDVRAVEGNSVTADGYGIGVSGAGGYYGLRGEAAAGSYTGAADGIYCTSTGTAGTRVGIFATASNPGGNAAYGVQGTASGASSNYAGYFSGNVYSTGSYLPSDKKLKENIQDVDDALALVSKLKVHAYNYRTEEFESMHLQEGLRYGFIAEELKKEFPQFVNRAVQMLNEPENEKGERIEVETMEFDAVNYVELIPILTKAIQELQKQVDVLMLQLEQQ